MIKRIGYSLFFISVFGNLIAQSPSIGGYNVYYGTLHNHSNVSDGTGTDDAAYNYARNIAKLDFFSTANHESYIVEEEWMAIKAAAEKYNEDSVFTAFWGFEWSHNGHVAVINTDDYPVISSDPCGTFVELCTWLDARNGIAFFNHPGRSTNMLFQGFATTPSEKFVGMELFNGTDDYTMHYYNDGFYLNDGNLNHFGEANSRGWRIGASGSDDNHAATWGTRTPYRMAILSNYLTRADLFTALQTRRFYSTLDKNLALSFKMDSAEMGSKIDGGQTEIQIQARDKDGESFSKVMLFRNGYEIKTWEIDTTDVDIHFTVNTFNGDFYYIKVTQSDGDEAVSSPIYIKGGTFNIHPKGSITTPENGIHFDSPQSISIEAEASDDDGTVSSVEFLVNGNPVGSDTLAPYSIDYNITDNGPYSVTAKITDDAGSWIISSSNTFTVGTFSEIRSSGIADGMDDVEESGDGSIYENSSDIELVYDGSNQKIGLRFTGLNIPPGATIQSASIQFTVDEASSETCKLYIKGHSSDNSLSFSTAVNNVSSRLTTSAEVIWEPPPWPTVGAAGADQKTPDLSSVIQEIVNLPGFNLIGAITIIITGTGERIAEAYEGDSGSAAKLTVNYTFGTVSSESGQAFDGRQIRIYPNPVSNGTVTVEINRGFEGGGTLTIFDISGSLCHMSRVDKNENVIDLTGMKSGFYIIKLTINSKVYSYKLLIK